MRGNIVSSAEMNYIDSGITNKSINFRKFYCGYGETKALTVRSGKRT